MSLLCAFRFSTGIEIPESKFSLTLIPGPLLANLYLHYDFNVGRLMPGWSEASPGQSSNDTQMTLSSTARAKSNQSPSSRHWHFYQSALRRMNDWLDRAIAGWLKQKYALNPSSAWLLLRRIAKSNRILFEHWRFGSPGRAV